MRAGLIVGEDHDRGSGRGLFAACWPPGSALSSYPPPTPVSPPSLLERPDREVEGRHCAQMAGPTLV